MERRKDVEMRRLFGGQRLRWARQELKEAREEKMPFLEESKDGGVEGVGEDPTFGKKAFPFHELPAELRQQIYSHLDYGTALRLTRASKFFYRDNPSAYIDLDQRLTYLFYADAFAHNDGRLACYSCIRARPRNEFLPEYRSGDFCRFGLRETERWCFDCCMKRGEEGLNWKKLWRFRLKRLVGEKDVVVDDSEV